MATLRHDVRLLKKNKDKFSGIIWC